jgi:hypothetical protein
MPKYKAYFIVPVTWTEDIEADSKEGAAKLADALLDNEGWCNGLSATINDQPADVLVEDIEVEDVG